MLYIIPTPIGNFEDLTFRSLRILRESELILTEDTRTSKKLLNHYKIKTPLMRYHSYNEYKIYTKILKLIKKDKISLISDSGTPGISDPGYLIIRECIKLGIHVECLPGSTAIIPALVQSGLPSQEFTFFGFLPYKKGRKSKIEVLSKEKRTLILYESPHKLLKTLKEFQNFLGSERYLVISKEISKKFEKIVRGSLREIILYFENNTPVGEFVLVLEGLR
ncbi:MAG TPA: 16S rRNA (cytidine(1402)-2'-O)-methyltransferase [Candidatus Angelobacter sp.]|jgi:16S rRNA (cytidine1402-2'-O)-methyltransferase|nr:16S rRNA (cytidine(1402)-2'-O)-methyltransferase [Candidatus Angelobacter sp.]